MRFRTMRDFIRKRSRPLCASLLLLIAAGFIAAGVNRGETLLVFNKAVNICMECIGLG